MQDSVPAVASPDQNAPMIMVEPAFAADFRASATKAGLEIVPTAIAEDVCDIAVFQFPPGTDVERFARRFNAMASARPWRIVQPPPLVPEIGEKRVLRSGCAAGG